MSDSVRHKVDIKLSFIPHLHFIRGLSHYQIWATGHNRVISKQDAEKSSGIKAMEEEVAISH